MRQYKAFKVKPDTALILVDVQSDFCPGGALAVPDGDKVVPVLNRYIQAFEQAKAPVYATRDWHPSDHCSFKPLGGPWPVHCVQGTIGARFHPGLRLPEGTVIISKGANSKEDAYSGFQGTDLAGRLKAQRIGRICVGGLATDYCVKGTVIDGLKAGFQVYFLSDASRAVNMNPTDGLKAVQEMLAVGAVSLTVDQLSI